MTTILYAHVQDVYDTMTAARLKNERKKKRAQTNGIIGGKNIESFENMKVDRAGKIFVARIIQQVRPYFWLALSIITRAVCDLRRNSPNRV